MELLSFFLMVAIPLGWLIWGLSKKGYFAAVGIPPMIFLFYAVFVLNTDPVLTVAQPDFCAPVVNNATVADNVTSYNNSILCEAQEPLRYEIAPTSLTIINYMMLLGTLAVLFLISKRIFEKLDKRKAMREANDE